MSGTDYTLTPNLGLYKPIPNFDLDAWGDHWNDNADVLDNVLMRSGGQMTGPLITAAGTGGSSLGIGIGNNTTGLWASGGNALVLQTGGGTNLYLSPTNNVMAAPLTMQGALTLAGNAASNAPLQAVPLQQLNSVVGNYLPLTGGRLSGWLMMGSAPGPPADATTAPFISAQHVALPLGNVVSWNLYLAGSAWQRLQAGYGAYIYADPTGPLNFAVFPTGAAGSVASQAASFTFAQNGELGSSGRMRAYGGHVIAGNGGPNGSSFGCFSSASWCAGMQGDAVGNQLNFGGMDGNGNLSTVWLACTSSTVSAPQSLSVGTIIGAGGSIRTTGSRIISQGGTNSQPSVCAYDTGSGCAGFWFYNGALRFGALDANGNATAEWAYLNGSNFYCEVPSFICQQNVYPSYGYNQGYVLFDNGASAYVSFASGWALRWDHSTGNLVWQTPNNANAFYCDSVGNFYSAASFTAAASVFAAGGLYASAQNMYFGNGGPGRIMQFQGNYYFSFDWNQGNTSYVLGGNTSWLMRNDGWSYNPWNVVGGNGPYQDISDIRAKRDIRQVTHGLAEILALEPISFQRIRPPMPTTKGMKPGRRDDVREIGFDAAQVQMHIPEAVRVAGIELPDGTGGLDSDSPTLSLGASTITAVMVNAIKEIDARLRAGGL